MITKAKNKDMADVKTKQNKEVFMFPGNPPITIEAETREEAEKKYLIIKNQ